MLTHSILVVYKFDLTMNPPGVISENNNMLSLKYIYIIGMARKLRQLKVSAEGI